jgi:uncharacterized protein YjbI with pentapeptide repeats
MRPIGRGSRTKPAVTAAVAGLLLGLAMLAWAAPVEAGTPKMRISKPWLVDGAGALKLRVAVRTSGRGNHRLHLVTSVLGRRGIAPCATRTVSDVLPRSTRYVERLRIRLTGSQRRCLRKLPRAKRRRRLRAQLFYQVDRDRDGLHERTWQRSSRGHERRCERLHRGDKRGCRFPVLWLPSAKVKRLDLRKAKVGKIVARPDSARTNRRALSAGSAGAASASCYETAAGCANASFTFTNLSGLTLGAVDFDGASFLGVAFRGSSFGTASFNKTTITDTFFNGAKFDGDPTTFELAKVTAAPGGNGVVFANASFAGLARFTGISIAGADGGDGADAAPGQQGIDGVDSSPFHGADFTGATFEGFADFSSATVAGGAGGEGGAGSTPTGFPTTKLGESGGGGGDGSDGALFAGDSFEQGVDLTGATFTGGAGGGGGPGAEGSAFHGGGAGGGGGTGGPAAVFENVGFVGASVDGTAFLGGTGGAGNDNGSGSAWGDGGSAGTGGDGASISNSTGRLSFAPLSGTPASATGGDGGDGGGSGNGGSDGAPGGSGLSFVAPLPILCGSLTSTAGEDGAKTGPSVAAGAVGAGGAGLEPAALLPFSAC